MHTLEHLPVPMHKPAAVVIDCRDTPRFRVLCAMLCALSVHGPSALAGGPMPNGGQFVAGAGTISSKGTGLSITQGTPRASSTGAPSQSAMETA